MTRLVHTFALMGVALLSSGITATGGDVQLLMRGGGFELTGRLETFDGRNFVLSVPGVGKLTLRADRYECVAGLCPHLVPQPRAVARSDRPKRTPSDRKLAQVAGDVGF
jgi:hypothetical protein